MRDKENSIKTLVEFGVSRTQAKVYLTLAEKGTLTLRSASEYSGVGRPDTYRAMADLTKTGLIETILDNPTRYRAIEIADAIAILMGQKRREIMNLKEKSSKLLQQFEVKTEKHEADCETQFVIVPKGAACIKKRLSAIKNAKSSFDCITSFKRFNQTLLLASDDIIDAANRGVQIRFILDKFVMNKPLAKEFELFCRNTSCKAKFSADRPQSVVAIFDKKEVQIAISEEGDLTQVPMLWSNNSVLVNICQHHFNASWSGESEIRDNILEEIKFG
jgi:sugar-specific transcriptional regulator TrmB